jgi:hypothetical protein
MRSSKKLLEMMHDQERDYSTRVKARKKHRKMNKAALARPAAEFKGLVRKEGWPMVLPLPSLTFHSHTHAHIRLLLPPMHPLHHI